LKFYSRFYSTLSISRAFRRETQIIVHVLGVLVSNEATFEMLFSMVTSKQPGGVKSTFFKERSDVKKSMLIVLIGLLPT
jgi:hypothetical protein